MVLYFYFIVLNNVCISAWFIDMHSSVFTAINLMFSMNCSYRGGVDIEGRPVMVVVGAHFLLRCLDLERFVLHVVKVIDIIHLWQKLCYYSACFLRRL